MLKSGHSDDSDAAKVPPSHRPPATIRKKVLIFLLSASCLHAAAGANAPHGDHAAGATDFSAFSSEEALHYSQSAIGRTIGGYSLRDQHGAPVTLESFRGKPLVVSLIYTSCYHTCPLLTSHLHNVVEIAREALGRDSFSVVSVGFDAGVDTPERMKIFAEERGISDERWSFLSGDGETIGALTADLGFIFFPSTKGFDHLAQTTVLDAEGRVYRQVYGEKFEPPQLVEPLKEQVYGTGSIHPLNLSDWINNIRLFCTIYDPTTGRYIFDYSVFFTIITGIICLGAVFIFLVYQWRTNRPA